MIHHIFALIKFK